MAENIEVGDVVRATRTYGIENAGRHWTVDYIWQDGKTVSVSHGKGLQKVCQTFQLKDLSLIRKGRFNPGGLITKPLGYALPELFTSQPPPERNVFFAMDGDNVVAAYMDGFSGQYHPINLNNVNVQENPQVTEIYYTEDATGYSKYELAKEVEALEKSLAESDEKLERKAAKWRGAEAERGRIATNLATAKRDLERAQFRVPQEPRINGRTTVITFTKTFGGNLGRKYEYAAIRPAGLRSWSISGARQLSAKLSWSEVVEFIRSEEKSFTPEQAALSSIRVVKS